MEYAIFLTFGKDMACWSKRFCRADSFSNRSFVTSASPSLCTMPLIEKAIRYLNDKKNSKYLFYLPEPLHEGSSTIYSTWAKSSVLRAEKSWFRIRTFFSNPPQERIIFRNTSHRFGSRSIAMTSPESQRMFLSPKQKKQ